MATGYCELARCLVPLNTWKAAKIYRAKGMDLSRVVNRTMKHDRPRGQDSSGANPYPRRG